MTLRRALAAACIALVPAVPAAAQIMAVGIDTKFAFDDKGGRR